MEAHGEPKKNNALNTLAIATVGVVGAALVYVSIIGLQSFYVSETSPLAEVKSFGAQGEVKASLKAEQIGNITEAGRTKAKVGPDQTQLYSIGIDAAKKLIVRDARDASRLVPAVGPSTKPSVAPAFGRPQPLPPAPPPAPEPALDPATGLPVVPADGVAPAGGAGPVPAGGAAAPAAATPAAATPPAAPAATPPAAPTAPAAGTPR